MFLLELSECRGSEHASHPALFIILAKLSSRAMEHGVERQQRTPIDVI